MSDGSRAIEELKGSLETAAIQMRNTLAPIVQKVAELITALVNKFSALPEGVQQVIVVVGILVDIRTTTDGNQPGCHSGYLR